MNATGQPEPGRLHLVSFHRAAGVHICTPENIRTRLFISRLPRQVALVSATVGKRQKVLQNSNVVKPPRPYLGMIIRSREQFL